MNHRALIGIYSLTLLLSAALLFSVQPMFSKMILPLLGGTPQVWNTAMVFFSVSAAGGICLCAPDKQTIQTGNPSRNSYFTADFMPWRFADHDSGGCKTSH
jgi:hypothetical protein